MEQAWDMYRRTVMIAIKFAVFLCAATIVARTSSTLNVPAGAEFCSTLPTKVCIVAMDMRAIHYQVILQMFDRNERK